MSPSLFSAGANVHLRIFAVALVALAVFVAIGLNARGPSTGIAGKSVVVVKASKPSIYAEHDYVNAGAAWAVPQDDAD